MFRNIHNLLVRTILFASLVFVMACGDSPEEPGSSASENSSLSCNNLGNFSSYDNATRSIRNAEFQYEDVVHTSSSSWINKAEYYSCNGSTGYFIITLGDREYAYDEMPMEVWKSFKNADSYGSYYSTRIKGNYQLTLD
jgi:hypothetical protein